MHIIELNHDFSFQTVSFQCSQSLDDRNAVQNTVKSPCSLIIVILLAGEVSCTIFHSALPSQILSLFPLVLPCSNVSEHSVTPSPPVIFHHTLSRSVTSLHFPSSFTIFHLHCNLGYVPSSGYDPYPYQLSPPSSFSDLWL